MNMLSCLKFSIGLIAISVIVSDVAPAQSEHDTPGPSRSVLIKSLSWSPDGKEIVFSTNRKYEATVSAEGVRVKAFYLWRVGVDGKGLRQITFPEGDKHFSDRNPHWSPDGTKIVFDSDRGETLKDNLKEKLEQIFLCDADGKNIRKISKGEGRFINKQPVWSPDGKRLAWVTTRNGGGDILIADVQGNELGWVTVTPDINETEPSWCSDGARLVFKTEKNPLYHEAGERAPLSLSIRAVRKPAGTRDTRPASNKAQILAALWENFGLVGACSPKANTAALIVHNDPTANIWIINLDGANLRRVTDLAGKGISANYFVRPAWTPKGDGIAFVASSKRPLAADTFEEGIWICSISDGAVTEVPLPPVPMQ